MYNANPNEIQKCLKCSHVFFHVCGFESDSGLVLYLSCVNCGNVIDWYSSYSHFFDKDDTIIKCPHCNDQMIEIVGILSFEKENKHFLIMQCRNHGMRCMFIPFRVEYQPIKILNKGQRCEKCGDYSVISDWNKNKRGYDLICVNKECGFQKFESFE